MKRTVRWLAGGATALAVAAALLVWWVPSETELTARAQAEFEQRTGIGLRIGRLQWSVLPTPRVVLDEVATVQDEPIRVRRLALHAPWRSLWGPVRVDQVEVDGVVLPRESVRAFRGRGDAVPTSSGRWTLDALPVAQLRFTDLTWVDRRDIALAYDGRIDFDPHWRPRSADLRRADAPSPARLRLEREGEADRWRTLIDVGGGTWNGQTALATAEEGRLQLTGELEARNVDIELLMKSFGRSTPVAGKVNGQTELRATGEDPAALWRNAHTRTRFTVQPATLTRFDLAKAIRTAGTSRGGRTPLDSLTGVLDTQATGDGTRLQYSALKARSGVLTASGSARIFLRKLDGEVAVDVVDGVVGVPLKLGGTLDEPELSLTGGALTGAAVGTAVLPGVGTAIGARIGQQVERLFGGDKKKPAPRGPRAP